MKKHILKQFKNEGSSYDTYTIFKNPDSTLRAKISEFTLEDSDVISMGWPEKTWKILEKDGDEYKCQEGRNISYFPSKKIDEYRASNLKMQRNFAFPVYEYFTPLFGIISRLQDTRLKIISLEKANDFLGRMVGIDRKFDTTEVQGYTSFYNYDISTYDAIAVNFGVTGNLLNLYFTETGDFINRD